MCLINTCRVSIFRVVVTFRLLQISRLQNINCNISVKGQLALRARSQVFYHFQIILSEKRKWLRRTECCESSTGYILRHSNSSLTSQHRDTITVIHIRPESWKIFFNVKTWVWTHDLWIWHKPGSPRLTNKLANWNASLLSTTNFWSFNSCYRLQSFLLGAGKNKFFKYEHIDINKIKMIRM